MAQKKITINSKNIGKFLIGINDAEFIYLKHMVEIRSSIESIMKIHKLSKARFCAEMKLNPDKFLDFIKGNYNYSILELSALNALYIKLESEQLEKRATFQVKSSK